MTDDAAVAAKPTIQPLLQLVAVLSENSAEVTITDRMIGCR